MEQIERLIKRHRELKASNPMYSEKLINEYDVFKRYTSSKKDHGPQSRLVYNMRKMWPITIVNKQMLPRRIGKWPLVEGGVEIDDRERTRATIHAVDYWATFGEKCSEQVADSLISMQMNMVKEFFSLDLDNIEFCHNYTIRKPVTVQAPIENVRVSNVNNTLMGLFAPEVLGSRRLEQIDKEVLEKLKRNLSPIMSLRSTPSVVHLARSWITPKTKWLPISLSTDSSTSEISHVISSRYHQINVSIYNSSEDNSIERLCEELVIRAKESSNPKGKLQQYLGGSTISGVSLSIILLDYSNERAYTNICRCLLGYSVTTASHVRETKFTIIDSESPRVTSSKQWKFGMHVDMSHFSHFKGFAKVYFERLGINGYLEVKNREIKQVYMQANKGESVKEVLYDILYYCASIEPGFEKPFSLYTKPAERMNSFFKEHSANPIEFYRAYGVDKQGVVSNDLHYNVESRGYLQKVSKISQPIQPYDQTKYETYCDDALNVVRVGAQGREVVINSSNIRKTDWPLPVGLKVVHPELNNIITNPLKKFQLVAEFCLENGDQMERSIMSTIGEEDDQINSTISKILEPSSGQRAAKRKLEAIIDNDEDWNLNPVKRYKAFYLNLVANAPIERESHSTTGVPLSLKLRGTRDVIQQSRKRGLVTGGQTQILIMNKKIRLENDYALGYAQVGVYTQKPIIESVDSVEEAKEKDLNRFCIQSKGRYFVFEKKEYIWSESDNINKVDRDQLKEERAQDLERSFADILGI